MYTHQNKSVLVIEDEALVRNSIVELLTLRGFEVHTADNGISGVKSAAEHRPDLILSDIMMPDMSGLEVLEVLKGMEETCTTPFIFLTAKAEKSDFRRGMELGASDYIAKPFSRQELYNAIDAQLDKANTYRLIKENEIKELKLTLSVSLPHELRTPLNGIQSTSQFLINNSEGLDQEDRKELHEAIYKSSVRLNRLIQNYLLYTELELYDDNFRQKPEITLKNCTMDPEELLHSALNSMKQFEGFDGEIELFKEHDDAVAILIKPHHLHKVMEEMISNALKFHSDNTASVKINSVIDKNNSEYHLEVINYGVSMTPEEIAAISSYVQFSREKNEQQGMGLGLYIVHSLAKLYEGNLVVDSTENEGTRFSVTFPTSTDLD